MDLLSLLRKKTIPEKPPTEAPIGSGMAEQAKQTLKSLPYLKHVQEAKAEGREPLTPEEFAQMVGK
jgi:hypothetical protein